MRRTAIAAALVLACLIGACSGNDPLEAPVPAGFIPPRAQEPVRLAELETLQKFEAVENDIYRVGDGDLVVLDFWSDPALSGEVLIGPDGRVVLPLVGSVPIRELTVDEAEAKLVEEFSDFYVEPQLGLRIRQYAAHRIYLLGRVEEPGALSFQSPPTLLEALAVAGSLPVSGMGSELAALTRCAIFRGRDAVVWVDLARLLRGDPNYNIRLKRNDIVYLPDAQDQLVLVLGEVNSPGAIHLTPDMSLLDALAHAGGATEDGALGRMVFARPGADRKMVVSLDQLMDASTGRNVALVEGDILYVPSKKMAKVGYVLENLTSGLAIFLVTAATDG
ncbi:MAG: SLBB domain-containing protein [Acidobacteriota bacterium]